MLDFRFEFYVDCMVLTGSLPMPDDLIARILKSATRGKNMTLDNTPYLATVSKIHIFLNLYETTR